jgi:signal transduction histidine kinase
VAITLQARGDPVTAWCTDRVRFQQIAGNIVGNAVKFTQEGYIAVTLGLVPGPGRSTLLRMVRGRAAAGDVWKLWSS